MVLTTVQDRRRRGSSIGQTDDAVSGLLRPSITRVLTLKNRTLSPVVERFTTCAREVAKSQASRHSSSRRKCIEVAALNLLRCISLDLHRTD